MKQKIILTLLFLLCVNAVCVCASNDDDDKPVYLQVGDEAIRAAVQAGFEAFQGPLYSDPGLPAFTLISKSKRIALGVGGYVRFTTSFDFAGIVPNRDFIPFLIPVGQSAQRSQLIMDATTSRAYLRFLVDTKLGTLNFFVETDFRASGDRNRFSAIYASLKGFRIGRYWSVMADLESFPPSVDFQGPNAFLGGSTYQISYQGKFNKHFSYGLGLELPDYSIADSLSAYVLPQRIPTLPLYLQYGGVFGHVRAAGMIRPLIYKDIVTLKTNYAMTWGLVGSAFLKPLPKTFLYMQAIYGNGTGNFNFELSGNGLDLIPDQNKIGKLKPVKFWGGFVGIKYEFSKFFQISSTYSYLRLPKSDQIDPSFYKAGQYAVATGYFKITPRMELAIEYDHGNLDLRDNQSGSANRLIGMIRYDF